MIWEFASSPYQQFCAFMLVLGLWICLSLCWHTNRMLAKPKVPEVEKGNTQAGIGARWN